MGTYTTNYQLYMPTIGEQGWGELINGNYQTIDTTMKSLSNSIGTLKTETDAVEERVTALEKTIPEEGVINASSVTANTISGKIANVLTYRLTKNSSQACTRPLVLRGNSTGTRSGTATFNQYLFSDLIPGHVVGDETVSCTFAVSASRNAQVGSDPSLYSTLIVDGVTYVSSLGGTFTSSTNLNKSTTVNLPITSKVIQFTMSATNTSRFSSNNTKLTIDENIYIASTL